jgi:hypothetical protein
MVRLRKYKTIMQKDADIFFIKQAVWLPGKVKFTTCNARKKVFVGHNMQNVGQQKYRIIRCGNSGCK